MSISREEKSAVIESATAQVRSRPAPRGIGARAFIIGALLIIPNNYWVILMEKVRRGPYPTSISLFANVVFIFMVIWALNRLVFRISPRNALNQAEMLLVYTMLAIGSALAGHDSIPVLIQMLGHPFRFSGIGNNWLARFGEYLPNRVLVDDMSALEGYYSGSSSLYVMEHIQAWIVPVLIWTGFIMALMFVFACMNVLVRAQWMDKEKLSFPIVHLPVEMSNPENKLFKNKLMWAGFAIAGGIDLVNGFAFLYPSIPEITVRHVDLAPLITTKPWNAVAWLPYAFYPFAIGLGFLLPVDLLFSCWFFYLFWKLQLVFTSAMAWDTVPEFPFIREQCFGGYMAILVFLLYAGRHNLRQVWRRIVGLPSEAKDDQEAMGYRFAAVGALLGTFALIGFFVWIGLSLVLSVVGVGIYLALATAVTRMRAELGPPVHDLHFSGPDHLITRALGTRVISDRSLTGLTYFYWFNRAYRSHPMPVVMEGLKMAQVTRSIHRKFLWGIMLAALVGTLSAFWAFLHAAYVYGTAAKFNQGLWFAFEAYRRLDAWIASPLAPNIEAIWAGVVGFVFCMGLNILRTTAMWSPFHPIGYAISGSWSMNLVWMPLLIAWVLKLTILHFGGLRMYRQAIPFFLGLILGQCVVGSLWSLYGIAFDIPTYSFWGA